MSETELQELVKLREFKAFVHRYLDAHGVPHGDPENEHQKEGCRIGARLDLLFARLKEAVEAMAELREAFSDCEKAITKRARAVGETENHAICFDIAASMVQSHAESVIRGNVK